MRAPGAQRVQAPLSAPGQIAAQIRVGVVAGATLEPSQVGGDRKPQPVSIRHEMIGWNGG